MDGPRLAFYGDDFTGSTDAMQALSVAGVDTVLFLDPPTPADLEGRFADVTAVGLAGRSRSMSPAEMDRALPEAFDALDALDPDLVHYKVCSTFDSAPEIGSIGHAIDLGVDAFDPPLVPLVVGVPQLGRYVVFGNHFATVEDETYRLDRHPVMADHPVTPMTESDLRRVLGEQTDRPVGLVDALTVERGVDAVAETTDAADEDVVVYDTLYERHLGTLGTMLWDRATGADAPPFVVGSSGVEYALADRWTDLGLVAGEADFPDLDPVDSLVVVSGSASPVTDEQIERALDAGFVGVELDAPALVDPATVGAAVDDAVAAAVDAVERGESVVCYSARGPDDPAIERTERRADEVGVEAPGRRLADRQGEILRRVLDRTGVRRACVAGGDTCGRVAPALDIRALETLAPVAPGSPLCRAASTTERFDGLQIALKGGQLGGPDYFERVRRGEA